ncbi:MAG TPA: glycosyltransferase family 2 protein, partial [Chloroflexota bacterium]|nr:glycosyltransferase family 2 protein [Chloroflexota bacterium]
MSVCISTYNRSRYLRRAIESVLGQTFGDFELIVSDDRSPDDTAEVVAQYRDPRLRYHRNAENLGLVGNYNRCLELARGQYIGIFDDD